MNQRRCRERGSRFPYSRWSLLLLSSLSGVDLKIGIGFSNFRPHVDIDVDIDMDMRYGCGYMHTNILSLTYVVS